MSASQMKVIDYFEEEISQKDFAKYMRRFMHAAITLSLKDENQLHKEWIEDGFYNLTQFVEKIDPQLYDAI